MEEKQPCEDDLPTRLWPSAYLVSDDDESDLSDLSDIDIPSDDDDNPFLGPHQSLTPRQISFPDQPSSGSSRPDFSSPILERNAQDRKAHRLAKGHKKQARTLAQKRSEADHIKMNGHIQDLEEILSFIQSKGVRFGELLKYVFDPSNNKGRIHWHQLFIYSGEVAQILDWWSSKKYSMEARNQVIDWAINHVENLVSREAHKVTKTRLLQTRGRKVDGEFVSSFSFDKLYEDLSSENHAPISMRLIRALSTSRHAQKHTEQRKDRTTMVTTSAALTCFGEYSHANNYAKRLIGLYLYATGAQRQTISVLSTLGLSESYGNIIRKSSRRKIKKKILPNGQELQYAETTTGTLRQLSESMRAAARAEAATGLVEEVFDNINFANQNAEQIIGRHDNQENGTCATLIPLFDAKIDDLGVDDFRSRFLNAEPLKLEDILHSPEERKSFEENLVFTILRIIVDHGGEGFKLFEKSLEKNQPVTKDKIKLHRTHLFPLPALNIDESSIVGNAEVDEAIVKELNLDKIPEAKDRVRFIGGDQLSIARLRALEIIRAGHEDGYNGFFWGVWIPGLFHGKIADIHGTLLNHWGKPNSGDRNPGSLWFHNTRLDRLPITTTSLPTFRVCRDLVFVSLYARVLHCLLLVSGCVSLDDYLIKFGRNWETLVSHARNIFKQYANTAIVEDLRHSRDREKHQALESDETSTTTQGDMVFESAIIFLRDALISREFTNSIKGGDSGRVLLVLKIWALGFRGNGRTKYAYEMLHLVHNLGKVWGEKIRDIVLKNWLVNPTGNPNSWVELDLVQEHLNFWIKAFYKAHGVNATWEWLQMIAPCTDVLRKLARSFNNILGADQGTRHAPPDLTNDIQTLMDSLHEHGVYTLKKGRVLNDDDEPVKDVIAIGLQNLTEGAKNPLSEYNTAFSRLQAARRMQPVTSKSIPRSSPAPVGTSPPNSPSLQVNSPETPQEPTETPATDTILQPIALEEIADVTNNGEEEESSEMSALMLDLEHGLVEPTLQRLSAEDVALDMDLVEVVDGDDAGSDDDTDYEEEEVLSDA